ncbi:hypothetical protein F4775DRAFT_595187 [Biscogniauxia sp. FL1348]|nr:hypothetical protein F4775DRAFT_595187 [Biscogniauxia sp. FL1348]
MGKSHKKVKNPVGVAGAAENVHMNPTVFLAFDGFIFPQYPLQGFAATALETPVEGVDVTNPDSCENSALCKYNNALSLLTEALDARKLWTSSSNDEDFIRAVDMRWRLATTGVTRFLIHFFLKARRKHRTRHPGHTSDRPQKQDDSVFKQNYTAEGQEEAISQQQEATRLEYTQDVGKILSVLLGGKKIPGWKQCDRGGASYQPQSILSQLDPSASEEQYSCQGIAKKLLEEMALQEFVTQSEENLTAIMKFLEQDSTLSTRTILAAMIQIANGSIPGAGFNKFVCIELCVGLYNALAAMCAGVTDERKVQLCDSLKLIEKWAEHLDPQAAVQTAGKDGVGETGHGGAGSASRGGGGGGGGDDDDDDDIIIITVRVPRRRRLVSRRFAAPYWITEGEEEDDDDELDRGPTFEKQQIRQPSTTQREQGRSVSLLTLEFREATTSSSSSGENKGEPYQRAGNDSNAVGRAVEDAEADYEEAGGQDKGEHMGMK